MQGRELAVGWEEWVDLPCLGRWPFFLVVSPVLCRCLCSVLPTAGRPALQLPGPQNPMGDPARALSPPPPQVSTVL